MFKKIPVMLLVVIITIIFAGQFIPLPIKQRLYEISLFIKSLLVMLLPLLIFSLLFKASVNLAHHATRIIGLILVCVCGSSILCLFLSHYIGIWVYQMDLSIVLPKNSNELTPVWTISLPRLIENSHAMLLGLIGGISFGLTKRGLAKKIVFFLDRVVSKILNTFTYLIPLFVVGFIVKLQHDGSIYTIIKDYSKIFTIIAVSLYSYIFLAYLVISKGNLKTCLNSIQNMFPAAITAFSTMSSVAAMPLTIIGAENNVKNKDLTKSVIPATVNIHLVGDCFATPIFAYAILKNFSVPEPTFYSYFIFGFYFILAKFSVAAIPGGGIIVMLPILERYLGFNSEMMSLITALYILFDPFITCANVLGNGVFAKGIDYFSFNKKRKMA